ncbi:MAG: DUF3368 domain-containing protein [Sphaerospermopsis sp.]|nr:DUF3368 domain-containing protein [Sphaerospermopsis sp.]
MIVVSDTSPLSSLAIVGCLSLLREIYTIVIIPQAVAEELTNSSNEDSRISSVLSLEWVEIQQTSNLEFVELLRSKQNLDRGEAEAITLALELNANELLIDERLGRREATRLGLSIMGVLGILLIAKHGGLIHAVKPVMNDLISQASFRVSNQLYQEVLCAANELNE